MNNDIQSAINPEMVSKCFYDQPGVIFYRPQLKINKIYRIICNSFTIYYYCGIFQITDLFAILREKRNEKANRYLRNGISREHNELCKM